MRTEYENQDSDGFIADSLALISNFGHRYPWMVLIGTVLTCVASVITTYSFLTYNAQRNDLLSPDKSSYQRYKKYVEEFGDDDDLVVVVKGDDRKLMERALEDLADQVGQKGELFDRLFYKVDLRGLKNRALLFKPRDQIQLVHNKVLETEMTLLLYAPGMMGWKNLTISRLMDKVRVNAPKIGNNSDGDLFRRQFTAIFRQAGEFVHDPATYQNPWINILPMTDKEKDQERMMDEPQYFFSDDGVVATLLARPMKEEDGTFSPKSIKGMRTIVAETKKKFPQLQIGLTGLPVLESDEAIASQNDSNRATYLALAGVALLYLLVYRGFRYPFMTVTTLLVGLAWAVGWLTLTVGHLNILSSAFAVLLIGMGDYGVLWVSRFMQERRHGAAVADALHSTATKVGPSILTAASTAALAFYATMLGDMKAVSELGWIAGSGVLFCALSCFIVMPALLTISERLRRPYQPGAQATGSPGETCRSRSGVVADSPEVVLSLTDAQTDSRQWLPGLTQRPGWVIPISLAVMALLAYLACTIQYDHNLLHMQAESLDSVRWQHELMEHNSGKTWQALSYTTTPEEALALKARYEELPEVNGVEGAFLLVPLDQQRKIEMFRDIQERLSKLPKRGEPIPHSLPDSSSIVASAENLGKILDGLQDAKFRDLRESLVFLLNQIKQKTLPFSGASSLGLAGSPLGNGPFLLASGVISGRPKQLNETVDRRLQEFEQRIARSMADDFHKLRNVSTPSPILLTDLPDKFRERHVSKNGKWLLRIFAKENMWEYENLKKFAEQVQTVDPDACGKPFTTLEGLRAMKSGLSWACIYAFIAMVIVLLLDFGNIKHTLIALTPLCMGVTCTLGLMVLFGLSLNPANMIALPLVLGVGEDNGVHVLHDFRSRRRDRRYSLSFATGWGIMVKALTTVIGFGTLMFSQHRGLAGLGLVLTLGVTTCMVTALVFLPALLSWLSSRPRQAVSRPTISLPQTLIA